MKILGIETSCDETAAAVVEDGRKILSNVVFSQADMHEIYGGVVPEIASRKHVEKICAVTKKAISDAGMNKEDIDAIAVTCAPGLIGALLTGVNFAKGFSAALSKPLIPVHHIRGHIAANYLAFEDCRPPFLCLVMSGGHTLIVDVEDYTKMRVIGGTRDDAAGETFDKVARVMAIGYPGGAKLDKLAQKGDTHKYDIPRAKVSDSKYDVSFSGIKTAVINMIHNAQQKGEEIDDASLAASFNLSVCEMLVPRFVSAAKELGRNTWSAAGGVAANTMIRSALENEAKDAGATLFLPTLSLCGDNAAMIASQGFYEYISGSFAQSDQNAFANMNIEQNF